MPRGPRFSLAAPAETAPITDRCFGAARDARVPCRLELGASANGVCTQRVIAMRRLNGHDAWCTSWLSHCSECRRTAGAALWQPTTASLRPHMIRRPTLLKGSVDRCGVFLGDDEHPPEHVAGGYVRAIAGGTLCTRARSGHRGGGPAREKLGRLGSPRSPRPRSCRAPRAGTGWPASSWCASRSAAILYGKGSVSGPIPA